MLSNDISACCNKLVSLITNTPSSAMVIRRILRKSTLGDEEFDPVVHADLHFVEVISIHL